MNCHRSAEISSGGHVSKKFGSKRLEFGQSVFWLNSLTDRKNLAALHVLAGRQIRLEPRPFCFFSSALLLGYLLSQSIVALCLAQRCHGSKNTFTSSNFTLLRRSFSQLFAPLFLPLLVLPVTLPLQVTSVTA